MNLIDDLGFDSIKLLDLISKLESSFDFSFEGDDLDLDNVLSHRIVDTEILGKRAK